MRSDTPRDITLSTATIIGITIKHNFNYLTDFPKKTILYHKQYLHPLKFPVFSHRVLASKLCACTQLYNFGD